MGGPRIAPNWLWKRFPIRPLYEKEEVKKEEAEAEAEEASGKLPLGFVDCCLAYGSRWGVGVCVCGGGLLLGRAGGGFFVRGWVGCEG